MGYLKDENFIKLLNCSGGFGELPTAYKYQRYLYCVKFEEATVGLIPGIVVDFGKRKHFKKVPFQGKKSTFLAKKSTHFAKKKKKKKSTFGAEKST